MKKIYTLSYLIELGISIIWVFTGANGLRTDEKLSQEQLTSGDARFQT